LGAQDIRITSISDRENTGTEELTTSGTKIDVVTIVVVNTSLGQHGVVLDLRLAERRTVTSNDDQLGYNRRKMLAKRFGGTISAQGTEDYIIFLGSCPPIKSIKCSLMYYLPFP